MSAIYFHLFSPISPLANIVAVPLGTLALMSNLGALICGTWLPFATELFNHAAWFFMSAMMRVSEWFTQIPGSFFYVPAPSWLAIGIYYAVLVGALSGWLFAPARRIWSTAILILIAAICFWRWEKSRAETELTVLPLNGGHAVFVDAAGRKNDWLVNCGNENAVEFTLKPFLRAQGVNKIPRLVLTEGDSLNTGGAESLDKVFSVGELVTGPVLFRSSAYRNIVAEFEKPPARHQTVKRGDAAGCWQVLHPDAGENFAHADDMRRWCCSEIFAARAFCCCLIWGATGKARCSHKQTICAPTLSSPVCRKKANRFATRCSMRSNRKSSSLPTRNSRRRAVRAVT